MDSLNPIDLKEDVEKYQARSTTTEVKFKKHSHSNIVYNREKGELICPCGVAFGGSRLDELFQKLTSPIR